MIYQYDDDNPEVIAVRLLYGGEGRVALTDMMGGDRKIARSARVSTGGKVKTREEDEQLVDDLMRQGHTGPFEHVVTTWYVRAPLFVREEWFRHRTQSQSAESQRYREIKRPVGYLPAAADMGMQPTRLPGQSPQGRRACTVDEASLGLAILREQYASAFHIYHELIERGYARELARLVLPMGLFTEWQSTVNLWNLMQFLRLRCAPGAQLEIRQAALAMGEIAMAYWPAAMLAFEKYVLRTSEWSGFTATQGA